MTHRSQVDGATAAELMRGDRGTPRVEVLRIGPDDGTALGLDDVTPKARGGKLCGAKSALQGDMILFPRWQGVEFADFQAKQITHIMGVTRVRRDVMLID